MKDKIECKDCKWFKKNEYNEKTGYCHMAPPMWLRNGINCKCFFAAVAIDDFCSKAEKKEDAKPEFVTVGKVEAGDAVYAITRGELEKMKEENHKLKEAKKELLLQLKTVCANYGTDCYCRWYTKGGCKGMNSFTCTLFNTIKKYDREEG